MSPTYMALRSRRKSDNIYSNNYIASRITSQINSDSTGSHGPRTPQTQPATKHDTTTTHVTINLHQRGRRGRPIGTHLTDVTRFFAALSRRRSRGSRIPNQATTITSPHRRRAWLSSRSDNCHVSTRRGHNYAIARRATR
jgi:hypothetical protein